MQITQHDLERRSEDDFAKRLGILADSGAGVVHVRSNERLRALHVMRKTLLVQGHNYLEWDVISGVTKYDIDNIYSPEIPGDGVVDIHTVFGIFNQMLQGAKPYSWHDPEDPDTYTFMVVSNAQYWLENNPVLAHYLQHYSSLLPETNLRLILLTPDAPLADNLDDLVATVTLEPPAHSELVDYLKGVLEVVDDDLVEVSEEGIDTICYAGAGMSKNAFELYASLSIVDAATDNDDVVDTTTLVEGISAGKTEIVNKNDLLELYPTTSMEDVGGMGNLKDWVGKRAKCYTDDAFDFGISPPKGMVFVGLPGTGKSLAAKAIASEFGVPLVRLDFGKVFNSLVGKSEERMRVALSMVESMAPCVLFCDEIDKGLGGIGGSGDSGTSSRVLGSFLTWLQENKTPVFTMVTANNIDALPPELLRRGRFDAIFSTGFPTEEEMREVLAIHLRQRGWSIADYSKEDVALVLQASSGYVPAEMEAAVEDALVEAFSSDEDLSMSHIVAALESMVPLSVTYATKIKSMTDWMKNNAMPASKPTKTTRSRVTGKVSRITTRTRRKDNDKD